jgi:hypothetical protein
VASAAVTFEQRWPEGDPQWFELTVTPDGSASYRSIAHQASKPSADDPAPESVTFTLSAPSLQQLFAVGPHLPALRASLDKQKVAFTGNKTLSYRDQSGNSTQITYNSSSAPDLAALTSLLQSISRTVELSLALRSQSRFDKLSIDATLRYAENLAASRSLAEPHILRPVLERIAEDPAILNIARQRARRLLQIASGAHQR